jgi:aryl-alcohol dehydrogenase-like predicted oxidoreductase
VAKANGIADRKNYTRIVSVQPRYNLLFRMIEDDLVPMALDEGIGIMSYNPLAGGMLTGRYRKNSKAFIYFTHDCLEGATASKSSL